jgi:hypothetical protein
MLQLTARFAETPASRRTRPAIDPPRLAGHGVANDLDPLRGERQDAQMEQLVIHLRVLRDQPSQRLRGRTAKADKLAAIAEALLPSRAR